MVTRRTYRMMTCFLIFALLVSNLFVAAALAQELSNAEIETIEEIITTFASDFELGMKLLKDLIEENPDLAVLTIVELAREIPLKAVAAIVNLAEINPKVATTVLVAIGKHAVEDHPENDPKLAASLKAIIYESIVSMLNSGTGRGAGVAAVVVNSFKAIDPGLGAFLEEEAVAAGLERSYLLAASPIMP